ncbi:hypothetical protein FRB90_006782, partial [Tulasnella sp. 427]
MSKRRTNSGSNPSTHNHSNPSINDKPVWDILQGNDGGRRASGSGHTQYHIETAARPRNRAHEDDEISYVDDVSDPFRDRSREPSHARYHEDGDSYGFPNRASYEAMSHEAPSERVARAAGGGRALSPSRSRPNSQTSSVPPLPDPELYSRYPSKSQRVKATHPPTGGRTSYKSAKSLPPLPENASEIRAMSTTTRTDAEGDVPQRLFAGRRSDANQSLTGHIHRGARSVPAYTQATSVAQSQTPSNMDDKTHAHATGPMRRLAELMTGTPRNRLAALRTAAAGRKSTQGGGGGTTAQWTSAPASEVTESHANANPNPPLFSLGRIKSFGKKGKGKENEREKERSEAATATARTREPNRERRTRRAEVASWLPTEWVPSEVGSDLRADSPSTATAKPASQPPWKDDRRSTSQHHSRTDSRTKLPSVDESSEAPSPVIETGGSRFMSLNTPTVHKRPSSQQLSTSSTGSPVHRRTSSQHLRYAMPPLQEVPIPSTTTASPLPTPVSVMLDGEEHEVDDIPDIPSEAGEDEREHEHEHYSDVGYKATAAKAEEDAKEPSTTSSSHQAPPSYTTHPGSEDMPVGITTFQLPERRPNEPLTYADEKRQLMMAREEEQRRRNAGHQREPSVPVVRITSPTAQGSSDHQQRSVGGGSAPSSRPPSSVLPSRTPRDGGDEVEYEELPVSSIQQVLPTSVRQRTVDSTNRAPSTSRKSDRDVYAGKTTRASEREHGHGSTNLKHQPSNVTSASRKSERDVYPGRTNRTSERDHLDGATNLKHQPSNATSVMSRRSMPLRVTNPARSSTVSSEMESLGGSLPQPANEKVVVPPSPSMHDDGELLGDVMEEDEYSDEDEDEEGEDEEEDDDEELHFDRGLDHKEPIETDTETGTIKGGISPSRPPAPPSDSIRSPSIPESMPMPNHITVHTPSLPSTPKLRTKSPKLAESSKGTKIPYMLSRMLSQRDDDERIRHPKLIEWRSGPMEVQAALYGPLAEEGNDMPAEERI